jgi:hypothetical protein
MKTLILCSSPGVPLEPITKLLEHAGLSKGLNSKKKDQSFEQWHEQIFDANGQDCSGLFINQPLKPGKNWQNKAERLLHANISNKQWYWSASKAGWLLDFWEELEPQHRFVLIYSPPQFGICQSLLKVSKKDANLETIIQNWINYHKELLRFYHSHKKKCILVNYQQCLAYPNKFIKICKKNLSFNLNKKTSFQSDASANKMQSIEQLLFRLTAKHYPRIDLLFQELEASATPLSKQEKSQPVVKCDYKEQLINAWKNYRNLKAEHNGIVQYKQQNKEYETENELMLLQLHQVQEELEHYFLKYQELDQNSQSTGIIAFIEQKMQIDLPIQTQLIQVKQDSNGLHIDLINLQWQDQIWPQYHLQIIQSSIIYNQTNPATIRLPQQANNLLPLKTWPPQTADKSGAYWAINSDLLKSELTHSNFYPEDISFLHALLEQLPQWLQMLEKTIRVQNEHWFVYYQVIEEIKLVLDSVFKLQEMA